MEMCGRMCAVLVVLLMVMIREGDTQLAQNFYRFGCPNVESIVRQAIIKKMSQTFVTIPATLRLFFHDCFVEGCDGSILIQSTNGDAERDASDNLSLAGDGFDTVIKAKQAVEAACPGIVSCADILAIAARDVVVLSGGPNFSVELGRRDGLASHRWRVPGSLPSPEFNFNLLSWLFRKNNLSVTDMVALSGGHTVGFAHCSRFASRLYSFNATHNVDPSLDPTYARQLMQSCPKNVDPRVAVSMDPQTPNVFDNAYYRGLVKGRGIFKSDQVLLGHPMSKPIVNSFAFNAQSFRSAFGEAMVRLGRVGVKTGNQGEIRRDCSRFN
ncbi:peroxidase 51-like [Phalaenopsis equestris]|uniref:peroxidase 51-like n=1 Tax=Phalaenopsis equestris TaxID=78828 RepID=UPI0009E544E3|nr:peroxidase 51-like [Phalaenopsis equestris]